MTKTTVNAEKVSAFVVMPDAIESAFGVWWASIPDDHLVDPLHQVESMASALGLELNRSKSELICEDALIREAMLLEAPGLHVRNRDNADLLGSPIGSLESIG